MQDWDWGDLRTFQAVARAGSFARAAHATGQHETTIARRVRRLEQVTGHVLWRGSEAGVTGEGDLLLSHIDRMQAEAAAAANALSGRGWPTGSVAITAVPWIIQTAVLPVVGGWPETSPNIRLSLLSDHSNLRLMHGEADIALRMAQPRDEGEAVARKICDVPFAVAGRGDWVGYVDEVAHLPQAQWTEAEAGAVGLRISDIDAAHAAVRQGLGKAWLPMCMTKGLPLTQAKPRSRPLWYMLHPRSRHAPAIRSVVEDVLPLVMTRLHG
ncbi:LysR family transcriptional regulator [Tateyamaria omphalii]|uniref:LysR family transcriptional regulator n=1 Tax=Tateyamaria omphalii TaxID=299262 RepID=UPI001679F747|nr:LysR family transcriptional regulator [Tateyamaria omphalii]GGX47042.1 LysR family transcriptional regulator [Tateyamaria omphalii]